MSKYIIEFTKTGTICFTSHLDLMRVFKRAFKRTGIALAYSQGFNPHPKMGFAQPLSLGYWSMEEYIEFETPEPHDTHELMQRLASGLPEGIELKRCLNADGLSKTLASHTVAAEYMIAVPVRGGQETEGAVEETSVVAAGAPTGCADLSAETGEAAGAEETAGTAEAARTGGVAGAAEAAPQPGDPAVETDPDVVLADPRSLWHSYMDMDEIQVWKRQKKKKEPKKIDIRPMIREITFTLVPEGESGSSKAHRSDSKPDAEAGCQTEGGTILESATGRCRGGSAPAFATLYIDTTLDGGSGSNLSPELVITSALKRFGIDTDRSEISVMRKRLVFDRPLEQLL